jgi:hypothetical protein
MVKEDKGMKTTKCDALKGENKNEVKETYKNEKEKGGKRELKTLHTHIYRNLYNTAIK